MEKRENESKLYADEMYIKCAMWCVLFWMSVVSSSLCCSDCSQAALCQMSYPVALLKPSKFSLWSGSRPGNKQAFLCQGGKRFSLVYMSIFALNSQNCYCILCHRGIIHCGYLYLLTAASAFSGSPISLRGWSSDTTLIASRKQTLKVPQAGRMWKWDLNLLNSLKIWSGARKRYPNWITSHSSNHQKWKLNKHCLSLLSSTAVLLNYNKLFPFPFIFVVLTGYPLKMRKYSHNSF